MKHNRIFTKHSFLAVLSLVALSMVLLVLVNRNSSSSAFTAQDNPGKGRDEKDEKEKLPIALSLASLPDDPIERALRLARNGRYNNRNTEPMDRWPARSRESFVSSE